MMRVSVCVPELTTTVWLGAPVTFMTVPAPSPTRRLRIVELPLQTIFPQVHVVFEETASARTRSDVLTPARFISTVPMLAADWLVVPLPEVETVEAPAVTIPAMLADALPTVIAPPPLGSGPVSETAVVTPGAPPVVTVA